jgi:hypothetical protein
VFRVKWVERFEEMSPIETEDSIFCDLDEIVEKCRERLEGMGFSDSPGSMLVGSRKGPTFEVEIRLNNYAPEPADSAAMAQGSVRGAAGPRRPQDHGLNGIEGLIAGRRRCDAPLTRPLPMTTCGPVSFGIVRPHLVWERNLVLPANQRAWRPVVRSRSGRLPRARVWRAGCKEDSCGAHALAAAGCRSLQSGPP